MKFLLFSLAAILVLHSALADDVATTKKCEDFFSESTCDNFRKVAKEFNEKVGIVNQAITDAFNHHKTKAAEMLSYVKEYLVARATNFKCESVLSADQCQKLKDIATKLHLTATQAGVAIREAIVNGATKVQDVYQKALAYMRDRLSNLNCESVIGADQCQKLKDIAALIHVKATEVNKAIREAIIEGANNAKDQFNKAMAFLETEITCEKVFGKERCDQLKDAASKFHEKVGAINEAIKTAINKHLTNVQDILSSVRDTLVEKATNFKCTDVMSQDQCDKVNNIGAKLKLTANQISTALKEAIANGAEQAKQIYNRAMGFFLNDVKNLKCEDLVSVDTCNKVRDFAKKVHEKTTDAALAVKEAIINGAQNAQETYQKAVEFLKAKISCENVFSKEICDKIRGLADKFHVQLKQVDEFMREAIANGVTKVTDLYNAAVKYIMDKWTNIFGDEMLVEKRSIGDKIDEWKKKAKEALKKAREALKKFAEKIREKLKITSEVIRKQIAELIEKGKLKLKDVKAKILELKEKLKSKDGETHDALAKVYKRSVHDTLVEAFKNAHGKAKELIGKLLKFSKEKLEKLKQWLKDLNITGASADELADDLDLVHDVLETSTKEVFDDIVEDAINNIQE